MVRASKAAAAQGKKAAAAAANDAYEDNLDLVVALGWAHVDRITFEVRPDFLLSNILPARNSSTIFGAHVFIPICLM